MASASVFGASSINFYKHITHRTAIEIVTAKHTTFGRYTRNLLTTHRCHIHRILCKCHTGTTILGDGVLTIDANPHITINIRDNGISMRNCIYLGRFKISNFDSTR